MSAQSRVWFVTGASSGFGKALAEAVLKKGERAVLVARRPEALAGLASAHPGRAIAIPTDPLDSAQRARAVERAMEAFARIDVLASPGGDRSAPRRNSPRPSCAPKWRSTSLPPLN